MNTFFSFNTFCFPFSSLQVVIKQRYRKRKHTWRIEGNQALLSLRNWAEELQSLLKHQSLSQKMYLELNWHHSRLEYIILAVWLALLKFRRIPNLKIECAGFLKHKKLAIYIFSLLLFIQAKVMGANMRTEYTYIVVSYYTKRSFWKYANTIVYNNCSSYIAM